jgi:2-octaprenyl-6-methoxyphenol hydroxylase
MPVKDAMQMAVIGAGPAGLALALHAARTLPAAQISLFDARPATADVSADARTLALSLGSIQFLRQLGGWPDTGTQPITEVHVSQTAAASGLGWGSAEVRLQASELGVAQLGGVLSYGALVGPLQQAWERAAALQPARLFTRMGTPVKAIKNLPGGVELESGIAERFDLAVVAEGGVFAEQARKAVVHDYRQTAWVGQATVQAATKGMAFERFTPDGPLALLPLPARADDEAGAARSALVWCVPSDRDPVRELDSAQRIALLNTLFPTAAGRIVALSALKAFPLGLNAERTLVQGRTVRIGNAAQTLHPVAGQGLNLGLRDAHELVRLLRWTDDIDRALGQAEWARGPDRWAMIAATDFLARSFTWTLPGLPSLRGLGMAALQATPPLKAWLARRMMFGLR